MTQRKHIGMHPIERRLLHLLAFAFLLIVALRWLHADAYL